MILFLVQAINILQGIFFFKHLHYCPAKSNPSLMTGGKNQTICVYPWDDVAVEEIQKCSSYRSLSVGKTTLLLHEGIKTKQNINALHCWVVEVGCYRFSLQCQVCVLTTYVQTAGPQATFHKVLFVHFYSSQSVSQMFSGLDIGR